MFLVHSKAIRSILAFPSTTDDEFLAQAEVMEEDREMAIAIRRTIAVMCGLDKERISADVPYQTILRGARSFLRDWMDYTDFVMRLERDIEEKIFLSQRDAAAAIPPSAKTFGDWLRYMAGAIRRSLREA